MRKPPPPIDHRWVADIQTGPRHLANPRHTTGPTGVLLVLHGMMIGSMMLGFCLLVLGLPLLLFVMVLRYMGML